MRRPGIFIRDENGKVFTDNNNNSNTLEDNLENSDLNLSSNLSSSTEIDTEEKEPIHRSKRLTKTNQIVRYNTAVCHDYRKQRRKTELGGHTKSSRSSTGEEIRQPLDRSKNRIQTLQPVANRYRSNCPERSIVDQKLDQWRTDRHNRKQNAPIGRSPANSGGGNVEDRRTHLDSKNYLVCFLVCVYSYYCYLYIKYLPCHISADETLF